MADPLSIAAGIIAVTTLAFTSGTALHSLLSTIHSAPETFLDLKTYISSFLATLQALSTHLTTPNNINLLSQDQLLCLQKTHPILEGCALACQEFSQKIRTLTSHSEGRKSRRDGVKLWMQGKSIADFRVRLVGWKISLGLAVDVVLLNSMSVNMQACQALESKMDVATVQISGDLKDVKTRLSELGVGPEDLAVKGSLEQSLALCETVKQVAGHVFRDNSVRDEAKAAYGNVGNVREDSAFHVYEGNVAREKSRVVMGNMDSDSFLAFMK